MTTIPQQEAKKFPTSLKDRPLKIHGFKWSMVTGLDFGRAIRWARGRKNPVSEQIKALKK